MNQREFIRSKQDIVLDLMSSEYTPSEIGEYLLEEFPNFKVNSVNSFKRAVREVVKEFHDDLKEYKKKESEVKSKVDDFIDEGDEVILNELEYQDKYYYSKEKDLYFFFIQTPPISIKGSLIRKLKHDYSNMVGDGWSINHICRKYSLTRRIFVKIKTILGWTHDDDPFTNEEIVSEDFDVDDAVESMIMKKKKELSKKFNQEDFRMITKAARKWWRFERNEVNPFIEAFIQKMNNISRDNKSPLVVNVDKSQEGSNACVIAPYDLHYGKYASVLEVGDGLEYNKEIAEKHLFDCLTRMIPNIVKHGVSKFIVPIGSDFFHVDNPKNTTTAGTPQDMDGTFVEMASEGNKIMIKFIDLLRMIGSVEVVLCAGNHDYTMSHQLLEVLQAWYRDQIDVVVHNQRKDRTYVKFGNSMLGFTHGDGAKAKDLPNLMMRDDRRTYALTNFHAIFHGHLHHEVVKDYNGVKLYQMPSLSGSDRWHHKNGYEYSIRGLVGYIVHPENGVTVNLLENIL